MRPLARIVEGDGLSARFSTALALEMCQKCDVDYSKVERERQQAEVVYGGGR